MKTTESSKQEVLKTTDLYKQELLKKNTVVSYAFILAAAITIFTMFTLMHIGVFTKLAGYGIIAIYSFTLVGIWALRLSNKFPRAIPYLASAGIFIGALVPGQPPVAIGLTGIYILVVGAFYLNKSVAVVTTIESLIIGCYTLFYLNKDDTFQKLMFDPFFTFNLYIIIYLFVLQISAGNLFKNIEKINDDNEKVIKVQKETEKAIHQTALNLNNNFSIIKSTSEDNVIKFEVMNNKFNVINENTNRQSGSVMDMVASLEQVNGLVGQMVETIQFVLNNVNKTESETNENGVLITRTN